LPNGLRPFETREVRLGAPAGRSAVGHDRGRVRGRAV